MSRLTISVNTFRMDTDKEAALKPLEEAAEAFGAWQEYQRGFPFITFGGCDVYKQRLADEIADVIQAACNLADRHGIDLQEAMERCEERNRARGRYSATGIEVPDA